MDIARFAPTGSNSQGLSYIVIDDPKTLHKITEQTVVWLEEQSKKDSPAAKGYAKYATIYRASGQDVILRNAPCLVLATALRSFPRGKENAHFSLAYVELYASAIDLGTCWAGLLMAAVFSDFQPLLDLLPIPKEKCLAGAMLVGHPEYRYRRIVDKNPLDITFA